MNECSAKSSVYFGKTCSSGIAMGPAFIFTHQQIKVLKEKSENFQFEIEKLDQAYFKTENDLNKLIESQKLNGSNTSIEILEAHKMMLQDPEWKDQTLDLIKQGFTASFSLQESSRFFKSMLENLNDEYLKARADDIVDLTQRVLGYLIAGTKTQNKLLEPSILIAQDLLPTEFLSIDRNMILGIILENSSNSSHTAILAKTFEIPCIVGAKEVTQSVRNQDFILMDALKAQIQVNPDDTKKLQALKDLELQKIENKNLEIYIQKPSISLDQIEFEVASNLSCLDDLKIAQAKGTEGCGLFRSEFLLLDRQSMPLEHEQHEIYKTLLQNLKPHKVIIRLFDIGGDKQLPFLNLPKEENPFLGLRGLRLCLKNLDLMKPQLRALLRASQFGSLGIMAPMVTTREEVIQFRELLKICEEELLNEKLISTRPIYEVGIMVEVPAIAFILKDLIPLLDFISVGTNDLIQYLCATDRMNSEVAHLHDAYHPAVLRFLKLIAHETANSKVWMGLCGELAGQSDYVPLLMALGFKELSVSPGSLLKTRARICQTSVKASRALLEQALKAQSSIELKDLLGHIPKVGALQS